MSKHRAASRLFEPEEFADTRFDDRDTKAAFANQFAAFVEKGFPKHLFTRSFYERLIHTFGHIAHYNRDGFWAEFFETPEDRKRFVEACLNWIPVGDPGYCYSDVERALQKWMREQRVPQTAAACLDHEVERRERAELARLKAKYPDG